MKEEIVFTKVKQNGKKELNGNGRKNDMLSKFDLTHIASLVHRNKKNRFISRVFINNLTGDYFYVTGYQGYLFLVSSVFQM